ncbi:hypothetical protein NliqN6_4294 [Naganishia liquefaciens]|uniref:ABC transporter domain-containing protein n=1 Tax=Naganishia liquefaciens TaxID=104408 RepID=A0A8H3TVH0_9TREE|nr:hypothetical protein NliqN6_4294 [Naganishia liquefaciens]
MSSSFSDPVKASDMRWRRKRDSSSPTASRKDKQHLDPPTALTPSIALSPISSLWLRSRSSPTGALNPPGEDRAISLTTIRLALRLVPLLGADFAALFWQRHPLRLMAFLIGKVVKGVLPAFKIWAAAALLDLVQESFVDASAQKPIDERKVIRLALMSLFASAGTTIFNFVSSTNDILVRQYLTHHVESLYMAAQLSLDIPTLSDPFVGALMYEAGCFAGFESRNMRPGAGRGPMSNMMGGRRRSRPSPFMTLSTFFSTLTTSAEVFSAASLLAKTLRQAIHDNPLILKPKNTGRPFPSNLLPSESLLLILFAFLPAALSILGTFLTLALPARPGSSSSLGTLFSAKGKFSRKAARQSNTTWQETARDLQDIRDLGRNGAYKQEVVLFRLKDWVLAKWEQLREVQMQEELQSMNRAGYYVLGFGVAEEMVQTAFYALLALRTFSTSISLGSIRLYQSTADSLLSSIRTLTNNLESSVQSIFYMAAFFEMMRVTEKLSSMGRCGLKETSQKPVELLDYEAYRFEGGMKIEAKNVGFTYPGAEKPVLENINLVIEPGTTLAVVGFNGGGKTTLVKVLMGLYDHDGEILINNQPIERFPTHHIHARTTCCFQDHSKYSLTLRENVGIGNISKMSVDEAIHTAIVKGGATAVEDKVGLEGKLNRTGVPDASLGGGEDSAADGPTGGDLDGLPEHRPPPGFEGPPEGRGPPPGGRGGFGGGAGRGLFSATDSSRPRGPPPGAPPPEVMQMMQMNASGLTKLKERYALSGGQWQKLALARAFMRADDADLVVFDEPSAALDPRAEAELFERIHSLSGSNATGKKTTTIYISHRFSTVRRADKIAVVDKTIVEFGTHEELLAKGGTYAEFFNLQKGQFE